MLNQAFFVKVLAIQGDETVSGIRIETEIRKPFDTLLRSDLNVAEAALQRANGPRKLDKGRKVNLQRGDEGTRTPDPLRAKQVLYQLSYIPKITCGGASWNRTSDLSIISAAL